MLQNSLYFGAVVTVLGAILIQEPWSKEIRIGIITALCFIAAAYQQFTAGAIQIDPANGMSYLKALSGIVVASQGFYHIDSITQILGGIQKSTSFLPDGQPKAPLTSDQIKSIVQDEVKSVILHGITAEVGSVVHLSNGTNLNSPAATPNEPVGGFGSPTINVNPTEGTEYESGVSVPTITQEPMVTEDPYVPKAG